MAGKLYLVATPIGNLDDITFRAINILKEADIIAAEDTRHSLKLLNHYGISKHLISYHRHNEDVKTDLLIKKLLEGNDIAIITDAGTPGISDPGEDVVKEAIKNNIEVIPIPGACALISALIASGMNTKQFAFYGFLPLNKKNRKKELEKIKKEDKTIILYEAPHKLLKTLQDIKETLGDIKCVIARELTKIHEEYIRDSISNILTKIDEPRGEYIILLDLNDNIVSSEEDDIKEKSIEEQYKFYEEKGFEKKDIIKQIAKNRNVPKNEVYQMFAKDNEKSI